MDEVSDINTVPNEKQQHDITAGISNSFGFGGHNSVVAFAPFKQRSHCNAEGCVYAPE